MRTTNFGKSLRELTDPTMPEFRVTPTFLPACLDPDEIAAHADALRKTVTLLLDGAFGGSLKGLQGLVQRVGLAQPRTPIVGSLKSSCRWELTRQAKDAL